MPSGRRGEPLAAMADTFSSGARGWEVALPGRAIGLRSAESAAGGDFRPRRRARRAGRSHDAGGLALRKRGCAGFKRALRRRRDSNPRSRSTRDNGFQDRRSHSHSRTLSSSHSDIDSSRGRVRKGGRPTECARLERVAVPALRPTERDGTKSSNGGARDKRRGASEPHASADEERVTPPSSSFDLVFVFALTQVTAVIAADPTSAGQGRGLFVVFKFMRDLPVPHVSRGSTRRDTGAVGVSTW